MLTYQCRYHLESSGGEVTAVAFSRDGAFLAAACRDRLLVIYRISDGNIKTKIEAGSLLLSMVWQENGPLYVGREDGLIMCIDIDKVWILWASVVKLINISTSP